MKSTKISRNSAESMKIVAGSANVFEDLGFTRRDAAELKIKAELTRQIYHRIEKMGLTQTHAAARLGLSQPDVSRLMNAQPTRFSVDKLLALLSALEVDIDIVLRPKIVSRAHRPGVVRITAVARAS